jgi:hypothetical protein
MMISINLPSDKDTDDATQISKVSSMQECDRKIVTLTTGIEAITSLELLSTQISKPL